MSLATQNMVPVATPDVPVELDQVTELTPTLSVARPFNVIADPVVEKIVDAG